MAIVKTGSIYEVGTIQLNGETLSGVLNEKNNNQELILELSSTSEGRPNLTVSKSKKNNNFNVLMSNVNDYNDIEALANAAMTKFFELEEELKNE